MPIRHELDQLESADYDPWFIELYHHLDKVEDAAIKELDVTLAELFETTPLREKQEIVRIVSENTDELGESKGFDDNARRTIDESGNVVIIPDGKASFTESKLTKVLRLLKKHITSLAKTRNISMTSDE